MNKVIIYTDGACSLTTLSDDGGWTGPGGWGAVLQWNGMEKELMGGDFNTTNNRMELIGAIEALEALKRPCSVTVYSDSQYVIKGITSWVAKWKLKNWMIKKQPVKNIDLWQRLEAATLPHTIEWTWVKGHSGNAGNERADKLSVQGRLQHTK
jgi:ribonuclease HI